MPATLSESDQSPDILCLKAGLEIFFPMLFCFSVFLEQDVNMSICYHLIFSVPLLIMLYFASGVTLLFNEPPDARKPDVRWRLYVFRAGEVLNGKC